LEYSSIEELMTVNVRDIYAVREIRDEFLRVLKERNEVAGFRVEFVSKTRKSIMVSINAWLENDLVSGFYTDISEKVRAEQKLIDLNKELRDINEKVSIINTELQNSEALKKALLNNLPIWPG